MSARRALVLSGSIGHGHDSVADACLGALVRAGVSGDVVDCMELLGRVGSAAGDAVFRWMLTVPPLYDAFHFSQMRAGTRLADRAERAAAERLVPRLRRRLAAEPADLVVSVFATGAGALGRLRPEFPDTPAVVVCTDATAHRLWAHAGIDRYVVCSAMAAGTVRQYLPDADVVLVPPPVRAAFFEAPDRRSARAALDVDPDVPCALLMAGGWGLAPIHGAAEALAASGYRVLAVAGSNAGLLRRLAASEARLGPAWSGRHRLRLHRPGPGAARRGRRGRDVTRPDLSRGPRRRATAGAPRRGAGARSGEPPPRARARRRPGLHPGARRGGERGGGRPRRDRSGRAALAAAGSA